MIEYLLRTRSVATHLLTSLEIQPIRCAFLLCQFGRLRNVYVATRIILFSSTAESSATSGYISAKMMNRRVVMSNGLGKSLVLFQKWIKSMQ